MLKLKRLQILGFKSFCDRTDLKFHGDGIAAIIGPNGCGKSNIADAISWVLGEQSAKTLRGSRMEDVIFAGTRDRKPTGMAEVSLTLIDPEEYPGPDANAPTEIDIQDEVPLSAEALRRPADDWDEAAIRARAAEETERAVEDAQPGKTEEVEDRAFENYNSSRSPSPTTSRYSHCPSTLSSPLRLQPRSAARRRSCSRSAAANSTSSNSAQEKS